MRAYKPGYLHHVHVPTSIRKMILRERGGSFVKPHAGTAADKVGIVQSDSESYTDAQQVSTVLRWCR